MPEIPIFLMSKAVSDSAPTEGTLQNGSCNDHDSVIARELKIIAPSSQPSTPSKLWFDIQASRDLDCNRDDQADITETTSGMNRKKLSSITGCNPLKTPIKRSLDMDGQPDSSHPGSPVFENYSSLQFPDCDIIDDDKDHGKISAWGAKIGSVLGIPMRRIGSRKKSLDYRKPVQSGLDALERERNPPKAQPDLYSDGHDISVGGVKSQLPPHTSIEETLHDRQPSPTGETHHPVFQNTRDHAFGSSVRSPHQLAPAQSQSRMRQGFSKYSDKIATWRASPRTDGDHQSQPFASEKLSFSNPPKRFKSRVNRFLRPGQGNDAEDIIPPSVLHDEGSDISAGAFHVAILGAFTNSEQPPPTKLGFRSNLTKRVNSARKRMSLPFIFSPEVTPSDLPGHSFLPSEAKCVTVATTPPYLEHNHITQEWTLQDFRDMNMIRPSPPLSSPGSEDSPPQSPWSEVNNMTRSPTPPRALPIAPKINAVAPFESQERIPEIEAKESITKTSAVSPVITINHEHPHPEDPRDRPKSSTGTNELDATATLQGISALPGGKPIELLEEEERRNRRDSRVMGLNPETMPGDDRLPGQVHEDGRRDTYGAAIREIAGLELTLRGPPVLPSNRLGDLLLPLIRPNQKRQQSPKLNPTTHSPDQASFRPQTPSPNNLQ
ncbi:hypothetical protein L873DRAFT_707137 [Choiromyces venosus 120613-1]|uniref:Uncharacterized protein n=1 Tax=Choiromyces venosus 120613-1 TaxID=1336337 RepID=A0A3N4IW52_9PEZI|nr:hypothetical protein L873DRAFT_707137 [Choiromyces venosus 120613-1]